jgi:hypothetical protein
MSIIFVTEEHGFSCSENVLCFLRDTMLSFICRIARRISGTRTNAGLVSKFHVVCQVPYAVQATVTSIYSNKTFNNIQNSIQMLIVIIIIIT